MTQAQTRPWVFIVDEGGGRLLRARRVPPGRYQVEVQDRVTNEWKGREHSRPKGLTRTEVSAGPAGVSKTGYQFAQPHNEEKELRHEFAKEVAGRIEKRIKQHDIERLAVFAAPKMLGELRGCWPKAVKPVIEEHDQDLSWMGEAELLKHPVVSKVLNIT